MNAILNSRLLAANYPFKNTFSPFFSHSFSDHEIDSEYAWCDFQPENDRDPNTGQFSKKCGVLNLSFDPPCWHDWKYVFFLI